MFTLALVMMVPAVLGQEGEGSARLLVLKQIDSDEPVERDNLTATITIYNVGDSPAFEVEIEDHWPASLVDKVSGELSHTFAQIKAHDNATHTLVVRANTAGLLHIPPAKITYRMAPKAAHGEVVYSNTIDHLQVLTLAAYDKRHTKHYREWATFFILSAIWVGAPYYFKVNALQRLEKLKA